MRRSAETPLRPAHGDGGEVTFVAPKSDEGGSETQAGAQHHGKGRARGKVGGNRIKQAELF